MKKITTVVRLLQSPGLSALAIPPVIVDCPISYSDFLSYHTVHYFRTFNRRKTL